jgi:stage II sporulation protein D
VRVLLGAPRQKVDLDLPDGGTIYNTDGSLVAKIAPRSSWSLNLASAGPRDAGSPNRLALAATPQKGRGPRFIFTGKGSLDIATTRNLGSESGAVRNVSFVPSGLPSENRFALTTEAGYLIVPDARSSECAVPLVGINGQLYRGSLYLRPFISTSGSGGDQVTTTAIGVINIVKIEDYLLSVVPSEVPASWPAEVLKAQAIAARSYVVANLGKHKVDGYDVKDSVEDQVYRGVTSESDGTNLACAKTLGLVLKQNAQVISAFFHSTSGGSTELAENVWSKPLPYLKSVADYDDASPHFNWQRNFTVDQLNKLLGFQSGESVSATASAGAGDGVGYATLSQARNRDSSWSGARVSSNAGNTGNAGNAGNTGNGGNGGSSGSDGSARNAGSGGNARGLPLNDQITGIFIVGRHKSDGQRVKHVAVVGSTNGRMLTGSEMRKLLNLPSTQFSVYQADGGYVFSGRGNGHGLGLSQWGAKALADKGYNAGQILSYYYKDVTIESMVEPAGTNGSI